MHVQMVFARRRYLGRLLLGVCIRICVFMRMRVFVLLLLSRLLGVLPLLLLLELEPALLLKQMKVVLMKGVAIHSAIVDVDGTFVVIIVVVVVVVVFVVIVCIYIHRGRHNALGSSRSPSSNSSGSRGGSMGISGWCSPIIMAIFVVLLGLDERRRSCGRRLHHRVALRRPALHRGCWRLLVFLALHGRSGVGCGGSVAASAVVACGVHRCCHGVLASNIIA
mmetsp:Transcript_26981/g.75889  ORF Transcript_26981/g.75889 Transcript_26981/m.75889 type:complete len:222 (+) Transcript_26981:3903-4568(+)